MEREREGEINLVAKYVFYPSYWKQIFTSNGLVLKFDIFISFFLSLCVAINREESEVNKPPDGSACPQLKLAHSFINKK
jgi:hypothetical protein